MSNGNGDGFQVFAEGTIPDIYSDSVGFELSVYGVTLVFGQAQPGTKKGGQAKLPMIQRVKVHMSPQHAKVMAKVFVKNMRQYEQQVGSIAIPKALLDELGILEEW